MFRPKGGDPIQLRTAFGDHVAALAIVSAVLAALYERNASGKGWSSVKAQLDAALQEYAREGYCSSFGDWHRDIHALGTSLEGPRGERYVISCGGPGYLLPKDMMTTRIAPHSSP